MNVKNPILYVFLLPIVLICAGVIYTYFHYQFWTHVSTDHFKDLIEYQGEHIVGYRGRQVLVHKTFSPQLNNLEMYAKNNNVRLIVTNSYRPPNNSLKKTIVRPAKRSNHLAGYAIDFNVKYKNKTYTSSDLEKSNYTKLPSNIKNFFGRVRKDKKLRWGGDFYHEDPVHIDYPLNKLEPEKWINLNYRCFDDYSKADYKWKIFVNKIIGFIDFSL